jgi:hypothetical protein
MRIYKTRQFDKWAEKEGLADGLLREAIAEMERGLIDADLGGHVFKKRVALPGRGKSGGARSLLAYRHADRAFFIYGFAKNERDNIETHELKALRLLATNYLELSVVQLRHAVNECKLIEVSGDD